MVVSVVMILFLTENSAHFYGWKHLFFVEYGYISKGQGLGKPGEKQVDHVHSRLLSFAFRLSWTSPWIMQNKHTNEVFNTNKSAEDYDSPIETAAPIYVSCDERKLNILKEWFDEWWNVETCSADL